MKSTLIAVDTAKLVFEVAESDGGRVVRRYRLGRSQFAEYLGTRAQTSFVLEACGSAHHSARVMQHCGHSVRLLPVPYVRAYRRRNKTDRADCLAMLEAARNPEILPVPVKSPEAQAIQGLHRIRSQWMASHTSRINTLRGLLREFGVILPVGAITAQKLMGAAIDDEAVPPVIRDALQSLLAEIRQLGERVVEIERQLGVIAKQVPDIERIRQVSGIGLLTATALYASADDAKHFRSGRHLASWLGLTPRECYRLIFTSSTSSTSTRLRGRDIDHGVTVGPIRDKADTQLKLPSSFVTCGASDADSMKARPLSPLQAEYTTAADSLCLDLIPVFSAYLWEESIYAG